MVAKSTKRLGTVSAAILLVGLVATSGGSPAQADSNATFDAVGEATGIEVTASNPTIPAGIVVEGSGPTSQARLSSLGTSDAFAALPYPGETVANIPGVVTALINIPLPAYPLYVHAQNGTDPVSASYLGATLNAASTGNTSSAKATAGTDGVGYYASSDIAQDSDGSVSVKSVARQNGFDLGGLVTLSGVVSTAEAVLDSSGAVTTKSSLVVGRFVAPALKLDVPTQVCAPKVGCTNVPAPFGGLAISNPDLGLDADGFYIVLPLGAPVRFPIPTQTVLDALSKLGVNATYQAPITTPTSVVAASLVLKTTLPSLPDNPGFNGPTPVSFTLGRAQASVQGTVIPNDSAVGAGIPAGVDTGSLPPVDSGTVSLPSGDLGSGTTSTSPDLGGTTVPPAVSGAPTDGGEVGSSSPVLAASTRLPLHSIFFFYLVLVGVGLVGSIAGHVLRYVGVRSAWAS